MMTFGIEEELVQSLSNAIPARVCRCRTGAAEHSRPQVNYGEGIHEACTPCSSRPSRHRFHQRPSADALRGRATRCLSQCHGRTRIDRSPGPSWSKAPHHGRRHQGQRTTCRATHNFPTAIVCSNDMTAIGVLHGLHRTTQSVPQDFPLWIRRYSSRAVHAATAHHGPDVVQASCHGRCAGPARRALSLTILTRSRKNGRFPPSLWCGSPLHSRAAACRLWPCPLPRLACSQPIKN